MVKIIMKALLLLAHGSRSKQSNIEVVNLANKLRNKCSEQYKIIYPVFLELSAPLISEGIKMCVDDGATSILVLPYFLNSGRHVLEDIPSVINETEKLYPKVTIIIAPHIGTSELMEEVLMNSINGALSRS